MTTDQTTTAWEVDVEAYTTPSVRRALRDAADAVEVLTRDVRRVARQVLRARLEYEAQTAEALDDTIGIRERLDDALGIPTLRSALHALKDDVAHAATRRVFGQTPMWWAEEAADYRETVPWVAEAFDDLAGRLAEWVDHAQESGHQPTADQVAMLATFDTILAGRTRVPEPGGPVSPSRAAVRRDGPGRPTFVWEVFDVAERDVIRRHLQMMRLRNLRATHIDNRLGILSRVRYYVGVPLIDVTGEQLGGWLEHRAATVSAETRGVDLSHLREFYKWAIVEDLIVVNPTAKLVRPKRARRLPRPMGDEKVAQALREAPPGVTLILHLAAFAGLRACEIAGLDREDVLEAKSPPVLIVREGKGAKQRVVPLAPELVAVLHCEDLPASGPLIRKADGSGPVSRSLVCKRANDYLHDLGIEETLHQLRHWFASKVYAATSDLRLTQELMGHSTPVTTAGYAAWSPASGHDAVSRLGKSKE